MAKVTEEFLYELHGAVAQQLMLQVQDEDVSPAMIAQAVKFLSLNDITVASSEDQNLSEFSELLQEKRKKRNLRLISGED